MSNARNLANLLGTGTTIASAKIADDAITNAKILNDAVTGAKIEDNPTIAGNLTIAGEATAQGTTSGFGVNDRVLLNATDGSATDAGDFLVLNSTDGSADDGENIIFETASGDPNFFNFAGSEFFQVALTTLQDGISDGVATVVDFGGKGTVIYDTKLKFDSSNDAYEFDSADGVYLIMFSIGIRSDVVATEILVEVGGRVQFSTDNFSNTVARDIEFGTATRVLNNNSDSMGTMTVTGQYIYKNTSAGTKIRLQGQSNTTGGSYEFAHATDNMINIAFGPACRCTYLSVIRIA